MSSTKRRKLDADAASNASGGGGGRNSGSGTNAASTAGGRRGGGGPGSRGGHSAATASRAAAAASAANPASSGPAASGLGGQVAAQAYVPVLPLSALPTSALAKYALHYGLIPSVPLTVAQATFPTPALPLTLKLADSYTVPAQRGRTSAVESRRNRSPYASARGTRQPSPFTSSAQPAAARPSGDQRSEEQPDADLGATTRLPANAVANGDVAESAASSAGSASTPTNNNISGVSSSSSHQGAAHDQHVLDGRGMEWLEPGEAVAPELRGMTAFEGGEEQLRDRLGSLARTHWDKLATIKEAETVVNFAYAIRMRSKILKSAPMGV